MSDILRKAHASRSLPFSPMPKDANNLINPKKEVAKKEKKTKQYAKLTEKANKKRTSRRGKS